MSPYRDHRKIGVKKSSPKSDYSEWGLTTVNRNVKFVNEIWRKQALKKPDNSEVSTLSTQGLTAYKAVHNAWPYILSYSCWTLHNHWKLIY